jgi:phage terminase large subunit-like protein
MAAITAYHKYKANLIVAEDNNGGEMVEAVIKQIDPNVPIKRVHASRGKATRAEPVAAIAEQGRDHHVGNFPKLEDELCLWMVGDASPNRLDAKVWAITELSDGFAPMPAGQPAQKSKWLESSAPSDDGDKMDDEVENWTRQY